VWINNDGDGSVTVIDGKTDAVLKTIQPKVKGGGRIAASADGRWVASAAGAVAFVIDTKTKEIVASWGISPEGMRGGHGYPVFSPDGNTLHVMNESSDDMMTFNLRDMKAPGKRSAQLGGNFFGGGIRVLKK
jgi:DNA-binding beta-propeller fold protein YncE